jgi:hypothetical protein
MGNAMNDRREYEHTRAEKIVGNSASKPVTEANARQIGGEHYQAEYQHWDFVLDCRLDYLLGNASKYIARARKKGKALEDVDKALHYLQKQQQDKSDDAVLFGNWTMLVYRFAQANDLTFLQTRILEAIVHHNIPLAQELTLQFRYDLEDEPENPTSNVKPRLD